MKKSLCCLALSLIIQAYSVANHSIGYLDKEHCYKCMYDPVYKTKSSCNNCNHSQSRIVDFYLKAQVSKSFFKNFHQHWPSGGNKPDYMGGKVATRPTLGLAAGIIFKENFRLDISAQQRKLNYSSSADGALVSGCATYSENTQYQDIKSYAVSIDAYYHLTKWRRNLMSPYIAIGIGYTHNKSQKLSSKSVAGINELAFDAPGKITHNLSWNIGGGVWTKLTQNLQIDISYNYVSLGATGTLPVTVINTSAIPPSPAVITPSNQKLRAHEVAIGLVLIL